MTMIIYQRLAMWLVLGSSGCGGPTIDPGANTTSIAYEGSTDGCRASVPERIPLSVPMVCLPGASPNYLLYRPTGLDPQSPAPLVIYFHGFLAEAIEMPIFTMLSCTADANHFVLVYADSCTNSWLLLRHFNQDFAYVDALLSDVQARVNIDRSRVYAMGDSNGGMLSYRLLELYHQTFAAFAVYGTPSFTYPTMFPPVAPELGPPRPFMWVHGGQDKWAEWESPNGYLFNSTKQGARDRLVASYNCQPTSEVTSGTATFSTFDGCAGGVDIQSILISNMGHFQWPSPYSIFRPESLTVDANQKAWEFLARHSLP
jgi:polyhydroxybutyrate depolymerase